MRLVKDRSEILEDFFFFDARASDCYPLLDERDTVLEITLKLFKGLP